MTTLFLLRHAKAAPASAGGSDFERFLEASGRNDAVAMGKFFAQEELPSPDLVFCSPAARTRETLACFNDGASLSGLKVFDGDILYKGDSSDYIETIRTEAQNAETILVVGHNPMMEDLAHRLTGSRDSEAFRELQRGYVTSGLAQFEFDEGFAALDDGRGNLVLFETPATIDI
ncbi:SixA phosphatase family protein [Limoniibacter endophyticus]|uniref:Phosphoglycerate mutase n=1 Tax=Limoniibacter endophyticus TaxID=1565040 RepID=A0A8J3GGJ9_9HYPH|nr:histidine phosphatase family protein [Limoniibacter endophyticus]GHC60516.1 phosphoglycerate mutase [Limoniibacter endophyticus]